MKIYLFNPDTDMALANNKANYIAPAVVRRMAADLAVLPMWYAQSDAFVLAPSAYNADYLKQMQALFSLPVNLITEPELTEYFESQLIPWGWNPALCSRLLKAGLSMHSMLSPEDMTAYRRLSSRQMAVEVLKQLTDDGINECCGQSDCLHSLSDCKWFVEHQPACLLKAPWSGSGKGLYWCHGRFSTSVSGWCTRVLNEQEFVIGEPVYDKVMDFAMEFYSDGNGNVTFKGYSLFTTHENGAYGGNLLMGMAEIEERLKTYLSMELLNYIREKLCEILSKRYGLSYIGFLGVDMMICCREEQFLLHPCVEINVRMNMGVLSCLFHSNYMFPRSSGFLTMEYFPSPDLLMKRHVQFSHDYPLVVKDGKLFSGYLPLTPVTPQSRYRMYVNVIS